MRSISLLVAALMLAACSGDDQATPRDADTGAAVTSADGAALTGAGATFPFPLYQRWFYDYARSTGVRINYQSIGSGGGIRQLSEQTVDFGASDSPMTDAELAGAKGGPILHFPTVIGAVAIAYNIEGVPSGMKLTDEVLADIFRGDITKWNDPRIAQLNPGVAFPATDVLVVHRSDGSGTTYIFTDYLSSVSPAWQTAVGRGKDVSWPVGLGAKGNEGVAGQLRQMPGSITYIELAYANQNALSIAAIGNAAGNFILPSPASATAAAAGVAEQLPADTDFRVSIVNAPGADAYPIASFTWILVYRNQQVAVKGRKLVDFLEWALHDGQNTVQSLDYAPLPEALVRLETERLRTIDLAGAPTT